MSYQAFFAICLIGVVVASVVFSCRVRALIFGCVGFAVGYTFEMIGIAKDEWNYDGVDSILMVTGIPIEILFGYFTAAFFIIVLMDNIPDLSTKERREVVLQYAFLITGVVLLAYTYILGGMSLVVGWAFLGIFGLSVSSDKSIPLAVGLCAFFADWIVEGSLTARSEYYSGGWSITIAVVFMFISMFVVGILMNQQRIVEFISHRTEPRSVH